MPSGSRGILRRPGCGRRRSESLRARVFIIPAKPLETDALIVKIEDNPEAEIAAKRKPRGSRQFTFEALTCLVASSLSPESGLG